MAAKATTARRRRKVRSAATGPERKVAPAVPIRLRPNEVILLRRLLLAQSAPEGHPEHGVAEGLLGYLPEYVRDEATGEIFYAPLVTAT
jgi:hypothetical protein